MKGKTHRIVTKRRKLGAYRVSGERAARQRTLDKEIARRARSGDPVARRYLEQSENEKDAQNGHG